MSTSIDFDHYQFNSHRSLDKSQHTTTTTTTTVLSSSHHKTKSRSRQHWWYIVHIIHKTYCFLFWVQIYIYRRRTTMVNNNNMQDKSIYLSMLSDLNISGPIFSTFFLIQHWSLSKQTWNIVSCKLRNCVFQKYFYYF